MLITIDKNIRKEWEQTFSFLKLRLLKTYGNFFKLIDKIDTMLDKKVCESNYLAFDREIIEEHMKAVLRNIGPRSSSSTISPEAMENSKRLKGCLSSIHSRSVRI